MKSLILSQVLLLTLIYLSDGTEPINRQAGSWCSWLPWKCELQQAAHDSSLHFCRPRRRRLCACPPRGLRGKLCAVPFRNTTTVPPTISSTSYWLSDLHYHDDSLLCHLIPLSKCPAQPPAASPWCPWTWWSTWTASCGPIRRSRARECSCPSSSRPLTMCNKTYEVEKQEQEKPACPTASLWCKWDSWQRCIDDEDSCSYGMSIRERRCACPWAVGPNATTCKGEKLQSRRCSDVLKCAPSYGIGDGVKSMIGIGVFFIVVVAVGGFACCQKKKRQSPLVEIRPGVRVCQEVLQMDMRAAAAAAAAAENQGEAPPQPTETENENETENETAQ